jgi:NAD-dependent dihydropyrimidine dehydrogenase PreA subunit
MSPEMGRSAAPDGGALFIAVEVDEPVASDPGMAAKLEEICPVDIFRATGHGVEIRQENLDECVLCELCINAVPAGTIRVIKLYSGRTLPASA